jgi:hypothetical protein
MKQAPQQCQLGKLQKAPPDITGGAFFNGVNAAQAGLQVILVRLDESLLVHFLRHYHDTLLQQRIALAVQEVYNEAK